MKICIIAFARTRSSMLLETISLYYGIPILGEKINFLPAEMLPSEYKLIIIADSQSSSGVIRLHPRHFYPRKILNLSEDDRRYQFDLFNFKHYDQIYCVYRESIPDVIASYLVADKLNTFTYQADIKPFEHIRPIILAEEHYKTIIGRVYSEKLVIKLKEYFEINKIEYKDLFYNNIPDFCKNNYPDTQTFHIETNYDYKSIIKNYDDILPLYNYYKSIT